MLLDSAVQVQSVGAAGKVDAIFPETAFYESYAWCLNAFPTAGQMRDHLREELESLRTTPPGWQRGERTINIFLLSHAMADAADEYLGGTAFDLSRMADVFAVLRPLAGTLNRMANLVCGLRAAMHWRVSRWRNQWESALNPFMVEMACAKGTDGVAPGPWIEPLTRLLRRRLPWNLLRTRPRIPAAFHSQDLAHPDVFTLGRKFAAECPAADRPLLIVGIRTAGSYLAPLLRGFLEAHGWSDVSTVTVQPDRALSARERRRLRSAVRRRPVVAVIEESVDSASMLGEVLLWLKGAGYPRSDLFALFPVHPNRCEWRSGPGGLALSGIRTVTVEPEEWHKAALLTPAAVERRVREYLEEEGATAILVDAPDAGGLRTKIASSREPGVDWRLKGVYEFEVRDAGGVRDKRFIVAKSVGWGWFGYHALVAGRRLAGTVPPVLGLREGILYTHWDCASRTDGGADRSAALRAAASYLGARVRELRLPDDPARDLILAGRHRGADELAGALSGAWGTKAAAMLRRPQLLRQLAEMTCPVPTLIDGKMRPAEWTGDADQLLKTDFEHHGMGKHELNVTDPVYDLAEVILHWQFSREEERQLIRAYTQDAGDPGAPARLFLAKLMAGIWAMSRAAENIRDPEFVHLHERFHRLYLNAWRFLTTQTARFCSALCLRLDTINGAAPVVSLDVDGVLDRQIFGFPSTTAAGIRAVSLLAAHGIPVSLNTTRTLEELKEYCRDYGFIGGVAEYGALVWDAVTGRERVLIGAESLAEMERLRNALREFPGVFLHDGCRFTLRAYTFARGTTIPLPEPMVRNLIARLGVKRICLHQTFTDSTFAATETDKGKGLLAFLDLAGRSGQATIAIGDSEADLPTFRAATRCFAPGNIGCARSARLLGCRIVNQPCQRGLLAIARALVHPDGGSCRLCRWPVPEMDERDRFFVQLLETADRSPLGLFLPSLLSPAALRAFRK